MKKELLTVALLMGTWVASAQVGIGTLNPNKSAQLDVVASDKGILIPQVSLTSVTDATTITNGNVESLLVYNKTNNEAIKPGYYYWFEGEWRKLLTPIDVTTDILTVLNYNTVNNTLTYVDENNVTHTFTLNNTKNSTIVLEGTVLTITDTDGDVYTVDLASLDTNTTNTSLVLDETNQLNLTDSAGNVLTANLAALAIDENTVNNSLTLNPTNNHLILVDSEGNNVEVDLSTLLDDTNTTNTSLVLGDDYILTLTDSEGNTRTVNLSSLVNTTKVTAGTNVTITGDGSVATPYVVNSKNTTNTSFTLNPTTNVLTLVDSDGNVVTIDLTNLAKNTTITNVTFDETTNNITITDSENNTQIVDISGVLKAKNGLHVADKNVVLGGDLTENTTIATAGNDLNIQGLTQADTTEGRKLMMVDDTTGKLRVADTKQIVDQVTNVDVTTVDNTVSVTVNGKTDSDTIIKTNTLTVNGSTLTSTVNGVSSDIDLESTITTTQNTSSVVSGTNTNVTSTVVGKNTEYKVDVATANTTNLGVVKQAATNPTVFINAAGELSTTASAGNNIIEVTSNYPIAEDDVVVLGNAGSDITITLPNPSGIKGRKLTIKKSDAENTTYVNVVSAAGNIEGETDLYTSLPYSGWDLMSDGTNWRIVNKF